MIRIILGKGAGVLTFDSESQAHPNRCAPVISTLIVDRFTNEQLWSMANISRGRQHRPQFTENVKAHQNHHCCTEDTVCWSINGKQMRWTLSYQVKIPVSAPVAWSNTSKTIMCKTHRRSTWLSFLLSFEFWLKRWTVALSVETRNTYFRE